VIIVNFIDKCYRKRLVIPLYLHVSQVSKLRPSETKENIVNMSIFYLTEHFRHVSSEYYFRVLLICTT